MTVAYATPAELDGYLPEGTVPLDAQRLLERASELLDDTVRRPFAIDDVTKLPTDTEIAEAMRDACMAQVEYWLTVGEAHDIEGMHDRGVSVGHLRVDALPPELGPRAIRTLHVAGLLSSTDLDTTAFRFFATQSGS